MKLIVTEKPSVANDVAKVLKVNNRKDGYIEGGGYFITWAVGHLVQLSLPPAYGEKYNTWSIDNLPIVPGEFKTEVKSSTKPQYNIIKKLMDNKEVTEIICATDSGREGQLIFEYIYNQANCTKPVKRLWISSMTDESIINGFKNLKDNKNYYNLYQSAISRAEADWLYGMNFSQLFSLKHNTTFSVGRVQTPTLNLIVERDLEIENFKPEDYFELEGQFENGLKALYYENDVTKFDKIEELMKIKNDLSDTGTVTSLKKKEKEKDRPQLFDLTSLQQESNNIYGYTAKETLDITQSLYEKHKIVTYPRTDSKYITSDMEDSLEGLLKGIKDSLNTTSPFIDKILSEGLNLGSRVINNEKVTDHHAIIVTNKINDYNLSNLSQKEENILKLIIVRFISALSQPKKYMETEVEIKVKEYLFKKKFKNILDYGYEEITKFFFNTKNTEDEITFNLKEDDIIRLLDSEILKKKTTPKKRYTESTLLSSMENISRQVEDELKEYVKEKGLGTPATRAGIIEALINRKYIKREKKNLISTNYGRSLINVVPKIIKSPETTAEWEEMLSKIETGQAQAQDFITNIKDNVVEIVKSNKEKAEDLSIKAKEEKEIIGQCPLCKKNIYESDINFYCEGFKDEPKCNFALWKNDKYFKAFEKKITKTFAKSILKNNKATLKGLKSSKGNIFDAEFSIISYKPFIKWKMKFMDKK